MLIKSMQVSSILFLVVGLFCLMACNCTIDPSKYVKWVEDESNGLKRNVSIGDYNIQMQYKPLNYILINEIRRDNISRDSVNERKKEIEGMQYYDLIIDVKDSNIPLPEFGARNSQEHYEKLNYYMYDFKYHIWLEEAGRKLPCRLFHFERTFNLTKHSTFVLAFDEDSLYRNESKVLVIESPELNIGTFKMEISQDNLKNIPTVNL